MGKKPGAKAAEAEKAEKAKKAASKDTKKVAASAEGGEEHHEKKGKGKKLAAKPQNKTESREKRHCKVTSCKRRYRAKGYCVAHYKMWRHGKFGRARYKICKDESICLKPAAGNRHGYCEDHFQNYYVKGMEVVHAAKPEAAEKPAASPKAEEKEAASA